MLDGQSRRCASPAACILQVSGEANQVFQRMMRVEAIEEAERIARGRAVEAGMGEAALASIDITDPRTAYLSGGARRACRRVVGEIASD